MPTPKQNCAVRQKQHSTGTLDVGLHLPHRGASLTCRPRGTSLTKRRAATKANLIRHGGEQLDQSIVAQITVFALAIALIVNFNICKNSENVSLELKVLNGKSMEQATPAKRLQQ
jgi:hypothetical protein